MLFTSLSFAIFLPIVFGLYWFVAYKSIKAQNILLLAASYYFYGCWDYRFLSLLVFSTLLDYLTGLQINKASETNKRRCWFYISVCVNLAFLGVFKYYNFFADSFRDALGLLGVHVHPWTLKVILPVGISFYTFHGLSYVIDIYKRRISPEESFITYAVFVSFFPLLVAGPIERATHLLPQIKAERTFRYHKAVDGMRQILWGLFKKMVIADNCAIYANDIFANAPQYSGSTLMLGAVFFAFEIYGDFSGYSDIALGTARLFGMELLRNFAYPYFSRDIAEFWRRWHISLSSWFRDYLYIPLGGSKGGIWQTSRNTMVIFLVSGFWHGANWTFIVWGLLHALYFMPLLLLKRNRNHLEIVANGNRFPSAKELLKMLFTFSLTTLAWIFFRSETLGHATSYVAAMFSHFGSYLLPGIYLKYKFLLMLIVFFIIIEWNGRGRQYAIAGMGLNWSPPLRLSVYVLLALVILLFGGREQGFIYFQF